MRGSNSSGKFKLSNCDSQKIVFSVLNLSTPKLFFGVFLFCFLGFFTLFSKLKHEFWGSDRLTRWSTLPTTYHFYLPMTFWTASRKLVNILRATAHRFLV